MKVDEYICDICGERFFGGNPHGEHWDEYTVDISGTKLYGFLVDAIERFDKENHIGEHKVTDICGMCLHRLGNALVHSVQEILFEKYKKEDK